MHTNNIRVSRIAQPRATFFAMMLLVVVFLGFGVVAEACSDENQASTSSHTTDHVVQRP